MCALHMYYSKAVQFKDLEMKSYLLIQESGKAAHFSIQFMSSADPKGWPSVGNNARPGTQVKHTLMLMSFTCTHVRTADRSDQHLQQDGPLAKSTTARVGSYSLAQQTFCSLYCQIQHPKGAGNLVLRSQSLEQKWSGKQPRCNRNWELWSVASSRLQDSGHQVQGGLYVAGCGAGVVQTHSDAQQSSSSGDLEWIVSVGL